MNTISVMKVVFIAFILFSVTGCSFFSKPLTPEQSNQKKEERLMQLKKQKIETLSKINLSDGVDGKEAEILAGQYFFSFISGCGMPLKPVDKGDFWEVGLVVGYAATKLDKNLIIDKETGRMSLDLKGMPTLTNPTTELINFDSRAVIQASPPEEWMNSSTNKN